MAIAVGNDAQFVRLLEVLGLDAEGRYATNAGRVAARAGAGPVARGRDRQLASGTSWSHALRAADVPAGPVASVGEALRAMEAAHDGALGAGGAAEMRLAPDPIRLDGESLPLRGVTAAAG